MGESWPMRCSVTPSGASRRCHSGLYTSPSHRAIEMKAGWLMVMSWLFLNVGGQRSILDAVQKLYVQQGIPFRENEFLDNRPILEEYDFVVIGSGPGGATVANRLSEVPQWSVLLLEGGPEGNIYNDIPLINPVSILGNFSKFYRVEKTRNACAALVNEECYWPAGEVLGGATIINAMLYTRGHPTDFDEWAAEGNPGWSYREVLPYFLKSERIAINKLVDSPYHSAKGPVQVEEPYSTNLVERWIRAGRELGYDSIDYNNPETTIGFSKSQVTMRRGRRESAASALLFPIKDRPNLHITKNTPVTRILIDPFTKRAFGVEFIRKGRTRTVVARNEVILSAGAFNSPKLLMLSGIGHRDHLEPLNIPVIQDLPVGDNLQEHLGTPLLNFFINTTDSVVFDKVLRNSPAYFMQWLSGKKGLFSNNGAEALGYIKTPFARNKPDIEFLFIPLTPGSDGGAMIRKTINIKDGEYEKIWGRHGFREGFTICPMMMYPRSRGKIRLRSNVFDDPPIVDGNFFADPFDVKTIIAGIREGLRVAKTKAFQEIGATQHTVPLDMCKQHKFNSDAYWDCTIRAVPIQWHHQCGTCKMGPDPGSSVVNHRLQVHGVEGLRIVDASVMPRMPGVHTMASSYMIGEKGADFIKEDWGILYNNFINERFL